MTKRPWATPSVCVMPLVALVLGAFAGCGSPADPPESRESVAKWVLSKGGRLVVSGKPGEIKSPSELPAGAFTIEKIVLNQSPLTDADLAQFLGLRHLQSLSLYGTNVGDKGLEPIAALTSLRELELSYTLVTDEGVKKLAALKNLRKLFLRGTTERVSAGAIKSIREALPACEVFR